MQKILIRKAGGDLEPFDPGKLIQSLQKAGAKEPDILKIVAEVEGKIREGMTTQDIYKYAFALLRKLARPVAARYSLKRAVMDLGPSGCPFEDFVAEIFRAKGYTAKTRQQVKGACVTHEVDLFAENKDRLIIGEAKFHNQLGTKSDLKVALYVGARIEDIRKKTAATGDRRTVEGWLITNTKFTRSAVDYANCVNLNLISWSYPRYGNLHDLIQETQVHPLTALTSLTRLEKNTLMEKGVVLCRSIEDNRRQLELLGIPPKRIATILAEGGEVCQPF